MHSLDDSGTADRTQNPLNTALDVGRLITNKLKFHQRSDLNLLFPV